MTPEDRLRLLRDPEQWNATLRARPDAFPARRRFSPLVVSFATVAVVAVVGVILFAVFGAGVRAIREPNLPPASPTPTATPVTQPSQVFDGDCANVFTDDQLAGFDAAPFAAYENTPSPGYSTDVDWTFAVEQVGGLGCTWTSELGTINVSILPSTVVAGIDDEDCGPGYSEGATGENFCGIEHETNGVHLSGGVSSTDGEAARSLARNVIEAFIVAAATTTAPSPVKDAAAWANPVDCANLDASIDASALFGDGVVWQSEVGGDAGPVPAVRPLVNAMTGLTCLFADDAGTKSAAVRVYGGGRWNEPEVAGREAVTPVEIPGVDAAYIEDDGVEDYGLYLHVFDGSNWLVLSNGVDTESLYPAAAALVDVLDTLPAQQSAPPEQPESAGLYLTEQGLGDGAEGDLVIGQPVPLGSSWVEWDATACTTGRWVPAGETGQDFTNSFWVQTEGDEKGGAITQIVILADGYATDTGIHRFSTRAELEAAYPEFAEVYDTESPDFDLYVLENDVSQTVFEVTKPGQSAGVEGSIDDTVNYIKIEDASLKAHPTPQHSCGA